MASQNPNNPENPNQTDAQKNAPQMENGKPVVPTTPVDSNGKPIAPAAESFTGGGDLVQMIARLAELRKLLGSENNPFSADNAQAQQVLIPKTARTTSGFPGGATPENNAADPTA